MPTKTHFAATLFFLAIASLFLIFSWYNWPPFDGDSESFIPPVITYRNGEGMLNPIWLEVEKFVPEAHFTYHGFLYAVLLSKMMLTPTFYSLANSIAILNCILLGLCTWLYHRLINKLNIPSYYHISLLGLAILGTCTPIIGLYGRPEPFAMLFICGAALSMQKLALKYHSWIAAFTIGFLGATHPVAAVLCGLLYSCYIHIPLVWTRAWLNIVITAIGSLIVFAMTFVLYPYSMMEWFKGCIHHAIYIYDSGFAGLRYYWFTCRFSTFYGLLYLVVLGCLLFLYWRYKHIIQSKISFWICVTLFFIAFYILVLRIPSRSYNGIIFAPLAYACILYTLKYCTCLKTKLTLLFVHLLFFLTAIGFLGYVFLFCYFVKYGMSYTDARKELQPIFSKRHSIGISAGVFCLTENFRNIRIIDNFQNIPDYSYIIIQQRNFGTTPPPKIEGYDLEKHNFSPIIPSVMGIKIAQSVHGYNFAIYKKSLEKVKNGN